MNWVVGMLRGTVFTRIVDSPSLVNRSEANAWARAFLKDHPSLAKGGHVGITIAVRPYENYFGEPEKSDD